MRKCAGVLSKMREPIAYCGKLGNQEYHITETFLILQLFYYISASALPSLIVGAR